MITRRTLLLSTGGLAVGLGLAPSVPAFGADGPRIAVATNEPWGTYHVEPMLPRVSTGGGALVLVAPDLSEVSADETVPVVPLAELEAWRPDLLVINGATEWPSHVAEEFPGLPLVASSFAYLTPDEADGARVVGPRLLAVTAGAGSEAEVFAAHLGIDTDRVRVVGNPALDDLPSHRPREGEVVIATSVTHPDDTGDAAPGSELLRSIASALDSRGYRVRVGLHPREDPDLWADFELADEGTVAASAHAESVIGIPGSVFPQVAAVGTPLVGVVADGLQTPDYITSLCRTVHTAEDALAAVTEAWLPDQETLNQAIGPVGGSADRLWSIWKQAAASATPTASASASPTASAPASSSPSITPTRSPASTSTPPADDSPDPDDRNLADTGGPAVLAAGLGLGALAAGAWAVRQGPTDGS